MHAERKRKKRSGPNIKPEYRLQLQSVNSAELAFVVATEFGQILQDAGVRIVLVDNDKKAHSKTVMDAWAEYDIKVWPGAGQVYDRTLISDLPERMAKNLANTLSILLMR